MKKIVFFGMLAFLAATVIGFGIWYHTPKTFLSAIDAEMITRIEVFNGGTGGRFTIANEEEIQAIVDSIQSTPTKRGKMSARYDGIGFSLTFFGEGEEDVEAFALNGINTLHDGRFFYHAEQELSCYAYLERLEAQYVLSATAADWGISLEALEAAPNGLTLVCRQSGGYATGDLNTGSFFTVEQFVNDAWCEVARLPQENDVVWTGEAWLIPREHTLRWQVDWTWLYGALSAGDYRIGKEIMQFHAAAQYEKTMAYAEFSIP